MANFNKAFNFRGGFQVDTDVLVVRGQNVGIGSTIPNERLVVDGVIQANGLDIRSTEDVRLERAEAGILTVTDTLDVGIETGSSLPYPDGTPQVRLTTGIITAANPAIGVVTYYGDGGRLLNLPTSQWLDVDVGLGFTSIYAQGYVGVNTNDPRYVFQVGGVPYTPKAGFNTSQRGVGIESGSIWASHDVSIGGTMTAEGEFIGIGSLITDLNASALKYGTIGSDRFGDINAANINASGILSASEIRSPIFIGNTIIGTATTAIGVQTTSQLDFATAVGDRIEARAKFISTEGFLQIGNDEDLSYVGDIEVSKESLATIYSLANAGSSRVYAGRQREIGQSREFGGIRFGGAVSNDPLSLENDLDLINYDVGNVNHYLHAGSGGINATIGKFQWIYGQSNSVLASLDRFGKFTIEDNISGSASLDVVGFATFRDDVYVGNDLYAGGAAVIGGDVTISGTLNLLGNINAGDLNFSGANFTDTVNVGLGASIAGVTLTPSGDVDASSTIKVVSGNSTLVQMNSSGQVLASGLVQTDGNVVSNAAVIAQDVNAIANITGPNNFSVSDLGLTVNVANIGQVSVSTHTATSVSAIDLSFSSTFTGPNGITADATAFNVDKMNVNDLTGNIIDGSTVGSGSNVITSSQVTFNTANIADVNSTNIITSNLTVNGDLAANNIIGGGDIDATNGSFDNILANNLRIDNAEILGVATAVTIDAETVETSFIQSSGGLVVETDTTFSNPVVFNSTVEISDVTVNTASATNLTADTLTATNIIGVSTTTPISMSDALRFDVAMELEADTLRTDDLILNGAKVSLDSIDDISFSFVPGINALSITLVSTATTTSPATTYQTDIPLTAI